MSDTSEARMVHCPNR